MSKRPMSEQCPNAIRDDLKAYLDHELSPFARLRVWRHLRTCAHCARELTMLQDTQERLKASMPNETPSEDLRGRIRAQIDTAGLTDERRRDKGRAGLIPRRLIPLAATVSVLVTVVCLYAIIAPIRERARQAADRSPEKHVGLAMLQYTQDYDEKFPAGKTANSSPSGKGWQTSPRYNLHPPGDPGPSYSQNPPLVVGLRTAHPGAAVDAVCLTYSDSTLMANDTDVTVNAMSPRQIARLAPDLQKIGTPDLAQVHHAQRVAKKHLGIPLTITIHILPEAAR